MRAYVKCWWNRRLVGFTHDVSKTLDVILRDQGLISSAFYTKPLRKAFTLEDPKSAKEDSQVVCLFALSGSEGAKAA